MKPGQILALIVAVALVALGAGLAAGVYGPKLLKARQAHEVAVDAGVGAALSVQGERQTAQAAADLNAAVQTAKGQIDDLVTQGRAAADADAPLADDRLDRLRRGDELLCRQRPALCPTLARPAGGG